ncbi:uncharacterized protein F5891DRAFT_1196269 [Suillus fuscotomentosus]|uniref:Uncharacterized protein n=1 Tax=Suillus fuscotomentosus TaxID=1912939 RepID=A0AAD4DTG5_9AGAM|nr:uncharacterized protein F5891DRAFT_1196269 [Suillus fuscotomentosus]KAG1893551.1 hypothetical protein F5891DRAFT_1196269 [Suillus fuscotomentosus]
MAHTKQTSGKSTGGPAKRGELPLGSFKCVTGRGQKIIKSVNAKALPTGLDTIQSAIEGTLKPQIWNLWCLLCRDGAPIMYECSYCPRSLCERCLVIPEESQKDIKSDNIFFRCPGCHEVRDKRAGKDINTLYFGFEDVKGKPVLARPAVIHGRIELSSRSEICTIPVLILNFVLDSIDCLGSPACIMRDALHSYVPADYREIIFDVGTAHKAKQHAMSMAKLVTELEPHQVGHIEVFIHSHLETVRSDIWGGFKSTRTKGEGGDPVAYTISDFFMLVLAGGMADYIKGATLWMLVCGHMVRETDAFNDFKDCIKHYQI